jgi:hypothetical protein
MSELGSPESLRALWAAHHASVVGFVLVALISYTRFNTPPTSRHSTTWGRYHTFALIYMALTLVIWIVLANTPALAAYVIPAVAKDIGLTADITKNLAAPLYAALALTISIPVIKPLKTLDERLRGFLQDAARIPWEARRLRGCLTGRTWLPRTRLQEAITKELAEAKFGSESISFADDGSAASVWTKVSALHRHLKNWQGTHSFVAIRANARFAAFYDKHKEEIGQIHRDYDLLSASAKELFPLLDDLGRSASAASVGAAASETEKRLAERARVRLSQNFIAEARRVEEKVCDVMSRALLKCGLTEGGRRAELDAMGFVVNVTPSRFFDEILAVYAAIAVVYVAVLFILRYPRFLQGGIIIATIYLGAIVAALYPKRWSWAKPSQQRPPLRAYLLSGAIGFVFAEVASLGLAILSTFSVGKAIRLLLDTSWPWGLIGGMTALLVAVLSDYGGPRSRWLETAIQALGTGAAAFVVWLIRVRLCEGAQRPDCVPPIAWVIGAALVAGGIIGFVIPTASRRPEVLLSVYGEWLLEASATKIEGGQCQATISMTPPKAIQAHATTPDPPIQHTAESSDEAMAQAIREARQWIKNTHPAKR